MLFPLINASELLTPYYALSSVNKSEEIDPEDVRENDIVGGGLLGSAPAAGGLPGRDAPRQLGGLHPLGNRPHQLGHQEGVPREGAVRLRTD